MSNIQLTPRGTITLLVGALGVLILIGAMVMSALSTVAPTRMYNACEYDAQMNVVCGQTPIPPQHQVDTFPPESAGIHVQPDGSGVGAHTYPPGTFVTG